MEENLGGSIVLALTVCLENTYSTIFRDNFLNSFLFIAKLFDKDLYAYSTNQEKHTRNNCRQKYEERWSRVLFSKKWVAVNGLMTDQLECC